MVIIQAEDHLAQRFVKLVIAQPGLDERFIFGIDRFPIQAVEILVQVFIPHHFPQVLEHAQLQIERQQRGGGQLGRGSEGSRGDGSRAGGAGRGRAGGRLQRGCGGYGQSAWAAGWGWRWVVQKPPGKPPGSRYSTSASGTSSQISRSEFVLRRMAYAPPSP
jgi:hypothetical protein